MAHPILTPRTYLAIYLVLLGLTALTVFLAMQAHLGDWEIAVALSIATVKTVLVGLYFMHLIYSGKLTWLILGAGVLFLCILLGLTLADYATRAWIPVRVPEELRIR